MTSLINKTLFQLPRRQTLVQKSLVLVAKGQDEELVPRKPCCWAVLLFCLYVVALFTGQVTETCVGLDIN